MRENRQQGSLSVAHQSARLTYRMTSEDNGKLMRRYWTSACAKCPLKSKCTTGSERPIPR